MKNNLTGFFQIEKNDKITSEDLKSLRKFYAPILGAQAIVLYEYLLDLASSSDKNSYHSNFELSALDILLGTTKEAITDARMKLEALSLIETFKDHVNSRVIFALNRPLDAKGIEKNMLIKQKIISLIGKNQFQRLLKDETFKNTFDRDEVEEISVDFDSYFYEAETTTIQSNLINNLKTSIEKMDKPKIVQQTQKSIPIFGVNIQSRLNFSNDNYYDNFYEAALKLNSFDFYKFLLNIQDIEEREITLIQKNLKNFKSDKLLNLTMLISYFLINGVSFKFVSSFAKELKKHSEIENMSFEEFELIMDNFVLNNSMDQISYMKFKALKSSYLGNL
ncbi:hypothetical protein C4M98_02065 [Mycoplasmopsis pullorum]|uniref:hypothetical protein n=2 Tax=Mycoplasmopsis pullorum TaxID=48003 RepID=UPI00111B848C|nr:hypothetical protein [Mycoplasmopsis pullorum]TNK81972.1 hypothetical protein C4M94_02440 [Mycoplasmopsis pullorum]TNK83389.1 hypothetical protein C4M80_00510 [Mycoplasmopsis pullorum]TNK85042.1 hypothetical protein C4M81_00535 [Mycoplasmopsis pullorum]TNK86179.1 hypothetical protein C4M85_00910 [Mycoplasmopsis pullorum]TNK86577.1 hypothetical protein C4M82_02880 [Mycoplasmopsis pullorum]